MANQPQRGQFETQEEFEDAMKNWNSNQDNNADTPNLGRIVAIVAGLLLLLACLFFFLNRGPSAEEEALQEKLEQAEERAERAEQEANTKVAPAPTTVVTPIWENEDDDADGLTNIQEESIGTLPGIPDFDGDGITDGDEVGDYSKLRDKDGDGYLDLPDEDSDGIADVFESSIEDADDDGSMDQVDPCNDDFHNQCARVKVCCNGQRVVEYNPKPTHASDCTFVCGDCSFTVKCGKHQCSKPVVHAPKRKSSPSDSPCNADLKKNGPIPKGYTSWCEYWAQNYPDKITWTNANKTRCTDICGNTHRDSGKGDGRGSSAKMVSLEDY
jgi:hypothetical protein